ncbi:MAG: hypothetical protein ACK475_06610 [Bacteroidota bacterium]|jgi:hypothetical protein
MNLIKWMQVFDSAVISATAVSSIVTVVSGWLIKTWAERSIERVKSDYTQQLEVLRNQLTLDVESFKMKLMKSEFIFKKRYEALTALITMNRNLKPGIIYSDMEWNDACDEIARAFLDIESRIDSYLKEHGAVLDKEIRDLLVKAIWLAGQNKFEVQGSYDVPSSANQAANDLWKLLHEAEDRLEQDLKDQYFLRV